MLTGLFAASNLTVDEDRIATYRVWNLLNTSILAGHQVVEPASPLIHQQVQDPMRTC